MVRINFYLAACYIKIIKQDRRGIESITGLYNIGDKNVAEKNVLDFCEQNNLTWYR